MRSPTKTPMMPEYTLFQTVQLLSETFFSISDNNDVNQENSIKKQKEILIHIYTKYLKIYK